MIELIQPLQIEEESNVSHIVLWLCNPFDITYSFRRTLQRIEEILTKKDKVESTLPPEAPMEDFIDGELKWGNKSYTLYYERSLGYMQFSSVSLCDVQEIYLALLPNTSLISAPSPNGKLA